MPSKGPGEYNVCKMCYTKLSAGASSSQVINAPPPEAYLKYVFDCVGIVQLIPFFL